MRIVNELLIKPPDHILYFAHIVHAFMKRYRAYSMRAFLSQTYQSKWFEIFLQNKLKPTGQYIRASWYRDRCFLRRTKNASQDWMWFCCSVPQVCCRWTLRWILSSAASITCQWRVQGANHCSVTSPRLSSISQTSTTTHLSLTAVATEPWLQRTVHLGTWFCRYHTFP